MKFDSGMSSMTFTNVWANSFTFFCSSWFGFSCCNSALSCSIAWAAIRLTGSVTSITSRSSTVAGVLGSKPVMQIQNRTHFIPTTVHSPNKYINLKLISTSVLLTVRFRRYRFGLEWLRVLCLCFRTCFSFTRLCTYRWFGLCCLLCLLFDLFFFCFFSKFVICNAMHLILSNTYWFGIYFYACTYVYVNWTDQFRRHPGLLEEVVVMTL